MTAPDKLDLQLPTWRFFFGFHAPSPIINKNPTSARWTKCGLYLDSWSVQCRSVRMTLVLQLGQQLWHLRSDCRSLNFVSFSGQGAMAQSPQKDGRMSTTTADWFSHLGHRSRKGTLHTARCSEDCWWVKYDGNIWKYDGECVTNAVDACSIPQVKACHGCWINAMVLEDAYFAWARRRIISSKTIYWCFC